MPPVRMWARLTGQDPYSIMQKIEYSPGTSDHEEHNSNQDLFRLMLDPIVDFTRDKANAVVLELGCGKGRNLQNLLNLGFKGQAQGADISKANIRFCRDRFKGSGRFETTNGLNLMPFPSEEADVVFSTIVLQHIPVWIVRNSLLGETHRLLKKGGRLYIQMGFGSSLVTPNGQKMAGYLENEVTALGTNGAFDVQVRTEAELTNHLENLGFTVLETVITPSFSDDQHDKWIFVTAEKM